MKIPIIMVLNFNFHSFVGFLKIGQFWFCMNLVMSEYLQVVNSTVIIATYLCKVYINSTRMAICFIKNCCGELGIL